ncbi:MAG: DUF4174 domain-containing protein [Rhodothermales bacterium]|nr:DUF4174 domain-containing protein [Rhodothermales bacterium]
MQFNESDYRWTHRLLYLFAPDAEHPDFLAQRQMIDHRDRGFLERDLLLVQVLDEGESLLGVEELDPGAADALRARHDIDPDRFVLVLVGKDGSEKARSSEPVPMADIFEQIDQMPMRLREIEQRNGRRRY